MHGREAPRVLVVDDHPGVRRALCTLLYRRGCAAEAAANGREALECLARERFDAVVSDIEMPVMDGLTLQRHVAARYPALRHRFLLCSSLYLPPLSGDSAVPFLQKPVRDDDLWAALCSLLATPAETPAETD